MPRGWGGGGLLLLAALESLTGGFNQDPDVIYLSNMSNEMCIYDLHISQHQKCIIQGNFNCLPTAPGPPPKRQLRAIQS